MNDRMFVFWQSTNAWLTSGRGAAMVVVFALASIHTLTALAGPLEFGPINASDGSTIITCSYPRDPNLSCQRGVGGYTTLTAYLNGAFIAVDTRFNEADSKITALQASQKLARDSQDTQLLALNARVSAWETDLKTKIADATAAEILALREQIAVLTAEVKTLREARQAQSKEGAKSRPGVR